MVWKIVQVLALIFGVLYHVYADLDSDSSDSDEDGHGDRKKKVVFMTVFGVIIVGAITATVVVCVCKKKKANLKRTTPSDEAVVCAGPLPDKADLSSSTTFNPESVYNITPNYEEFNKNQGQPDSDRQFVSPPPAYSYNQ